MLGLGPILVVPLTHLPLLFFGDQAMLLSVHLICFVQLVHCILGYENETGKCKIP